MPGVVSNISNLCGVAQAKALLAPALALALNGLKNPDCENLYGTAESRNNGWNPSDVLNSLLDPNGSRFGTIAFGPVPLPVEAVTTLIPGSGDAELGVPAQTVTIVNTVNLPDFWLQNRPFDNALTLLHELGHVYDFLSAYGSGGSAIKRDAFGGSRANDTLVIDNCLIVKPSLNSELSMLLLVRPGAVQIALIAAVFLNACNIDFVTEEKHNRRSESRDVISALRRLCDAESQSFATHKRYASLAELRAYENVSSESSGKAGLYKFTFESVGRGFAIYAERKSPSPTGFKQSFLIDSRCRVHDHYGPGRATEADPVSDP